MVRCAGESISDIGRDVTSCGAGGANWFSQTTTYYYDGDAAKSGAIGNYGQSWMQTTVQGEGIISFYWKVSSQNGPDFLEFVVDGVRQASISGVSEWQKKVISITGSGTHTLQWQYTKDSSSSYGSDCGWVDYVQWPTMLTDWDTVSYTYDPGGRRIAKAYDGHVVMKYFYDGDSIIAEYDATGALVHKYIYGPGVDQPICMIDVADANATYYYHFDGLGSVIALTDGSGDAVQLYEYSIFGEVSASDPNHPNRFLFTGRESDSETGLYYYRARYYNPYIGRFLQTDPVGYEAGMNWYAYCGNNPVNLVDPSGLKPTDPCLGPLVHVTNGTYNWWDSANPKTGVPLSESPGTDAASEAISWAWEHIGDASYSTSGTVDNFPAGPYSYKCNKFVADAYKKGADVDYPTYPGGNWPIVANDAAKQSFNMGDFNYVGNGDLKVGDILIFPPPGPNQHGHCAIYAGGGWMISAVPDKGVVYTRIVDDYHFKNNGGKIAVRRYNPKPL